MKKSIVLCALLALGAASVSAQSATPRLTARQVNQQLRIKEGAASGELTRGETRRLERQQTRIALDKEEAKSNGVVTPAERSRLNREQNRASKRIYALKHNTTTAR